MVFSLMEIFIWCAKGDTVCQAERRVKKRENIKIVNWKFYVLLFRNVFSLFLSFLTHVSVCFFALFFPLCSISLSPSSLFFLRWATNTLPPTPPITLNQDKLLFAYDVIYPPSRRFIVCLEFIMRVMFQLPSCRLKYGLICELIHSFIQRVSRFIRTERAREREMKKIAPKRFFDFYR